MGRQKRRGFVIAAGASFLGAGAPTHCVVKASHSPFGENVG